MQINALAMKSMLPQELEAFVFFTRLLFVGRSIVA